MHLGFGDVLLPVSEPSGQPTKTSVEGGRPQPNLINKPLEYYLTKLKVLDP